MRTLFFKKPHTSALYGLHQHVKWVPTLMQKTKQTTTKKNPPTTLKNNPTNCPTHLSTIIPKIHVLAYYLVS